VRGSTVAFVMTSRKARSMRNKRSYHVSVHIIVSEDGISTWKVSTPYCCSSGIKMLRYVGEAWRLSYSGAKRLVSNVVPI